MYLRFVFARTRDPHRRRLGILRGGTVLGLRGGLSDEISRWFVCHLAVPPKKVFSGGRALCWFKPEAHSCIDRLRDLSLLLERRGEKVWQIYSRNPGLITYSDEHQIVAIPNSFLPFRR